MLRRQRAKVMQRVIECIKECHEDGCTPEEIAEHAKEAALMRAVELDINPENLKAILEFLLKVLPIIIPLFTRK